MLARIAIRSQQGMISIRSQAARLEGATGKTQLSISGNNGARIQMKSTPPRVKIDQTPSLASIGIKTPLTQSSEFYADSYQKGLQHISTITQEGLQMLRIENGGNPIASIAQNKGYKDVQITVKAVELPNIQAIPGTLQVQNASVPVSTDWQTSDSTMRLVPGSISITLGVKPSIEIRVEPGAELHFPVPRGVGLNLDEAV